MSRLLIAHGSPDPRHCQAMQSLAAATEAASGTVTRVAFLEHDTPIVAEVLADLTEASDDHTDVLGLFLSDGYHARVDVPAVIAAAGATHRIVDHGTLGLGPWLIPALDRALTEVNAGAHDPGTGLALVAAGSAQPEAREQVVQLAASWQRERGGPVRPAFAAGPGPSLDEAVGMLSDTGCRRQAVALLMLAPGVLPDRVTDQAAAHSLPVSAPLCLADSPAPEVVTRVLHRTAARKIGGVWTPPILRAVV